MKKPRFIAKLNTGERVHKPKKGKGSYDRKNKGEEKGERDEGGSNQQIERD
tara:strand:- start:123 stop:275 length:153 start_codon:yes stop_codon:yes gene_type:complete